MLSHWDYPEPSWSSVTGQMLTLQTTTVARRCTKVFQISLPRATRRFIPGDESTRSRAQRQNAEGNISTETETLIDVRLMCNAARLKDIILILFPLTQAVSWLLLYFDQCFFDSSVTVLAFLFKSRGLCVCTKLNKWWQWMRLEMNVIHKIIMERKRVLLIFE